MYVRQSTKANQAGLAKTHDGTLIALYTTKSAYYAAPVFTKCTTAAAATVQPAAHTQNTVCAARLTCYNW